MSAAIVSLSNLRFAWPGQAPVLDIASFELQAGERL
ncbi:MAG: ABC transporter ATP-binding protein, partial [Pseudomonadota bacterium]